MPLRLLHSWNAFAQIAFNCDAEDAAVKLGRFLTLTPVSPLPSNTTFFRPAQLQKASIPIFVTLSGIHTLSTSLPQNQ